MLSLTSSTDRLLLQTREAPNPGTLRLTLYRGTLPALVTVSTSRTTVPALLTRDVSSLPLAAVRFKLRLSTGDTGSCTLPAAVAATALLSVPCGIAVAFTDQLMLPASKSSWVLTMLRLQLMLLPGSTKFVRLLHSKLSLRLTSLKPTLPLLTSCAVHFRGSPAQHAQPVGDRVQ